MLVVVVDVDRCGWITSVKSVLAVVDLVPCQELAKGGLLNGLGPFHLSGKLNPVDHFNFESCQNKQTC